MTPPRLPEHASPQQMRKALVRMRLELHRQELHYETLRLTQPLQQVRVFQRREQAQRGAFVQLRALGQLSERERGVTGTESAQQGKCTVDRSGATAGGVGVGDGWGGGFAGHGRVRGARGVRVDSVVGICHSFVGKNTVLSNETQVTAHFDVQHP